MPDIILQLRQNLRPHAHTIQLAASYLLIIMTMSISFSVVTYHTSAQEIGRQLPPGRAYSQLDILDSDAFRDYLQDRLSDGRHELLVRLVALNGFVLILGAFISYVLARRTLEPIEEALEAQSRFAADASHELRTPLATIHTENEVALRNPKLTLARSKALLKSNLEEVTRLQQLSEGLLHLARDDGKLPSLSSVSLSDVTREAINKLYREAQSKRIVIEDKVGDIRAHANSVSLEQIITILLDNAIKYSPDNTSISVTAKRQGKEVLLNVTDQGVGIAADDLSRIFTRFYRVDPSRTSRRVSGHGLGLALAAKLAQQQNGQITVTSKPGKGSTFVVHLMPNKS